MPHSPPPTPGLRACLATLSTLHAAVFAPAAYVLPLRSATVFAVLAGGLALLHVGVAGLAAAGSRRLEIAWRLAAVASLAFLAWAAWTVGSSALYLSEIYGAIGAGVGAALLALLAPVALVTLPFACWGLAATGGLRLPPKRAAVALTAVITGSLALGWAAAPRAGAELHPAAGGPPAKMGGWEALPQSSEAPALARAGAARCARAFGAAGAEATALVAFTGHDGAPSARCLQAPAALLWDAVAQLLREEATRNPVAVDLVVASRPVDAAPPGLAGLALRPGYDGVCAQLGASGAQVCLAPWQLLSRDAFVSETPLAFIPDMRVGTSEEALRAALEAPEGPLFAVQSEQLVLTADGDWQRLERLRPPRPSLSTEGIDAATEAAQRYVVRAQTRSGIFRYKLAPASGRQTTAGWGLPRQAGTTLTLCELGGDTEDVRQAITRSLARMALGEQHFGGLSMLTESTDQGRASLGGTALPLIAFLACRPRVGGAHDALVGRLLKTVMGLQRPSGGFHPAVLRTIPGATRIEAGGEPLYASGQAVMALVMAEALAHTSPEAAAALPPGEELRAAADRAMDYYAGPYWGFAMRDFFYIEENWHCLAAREALGHHRHDAYERFCLDNVAFKDRTMLDASSDVDPTFIGGHGFGNLIAPHNTPTGGYGEIAAAAILIREARGEDVTEARARLQRTLEFLLTQQWTPEACFACADGAAVGAWSESISSSIIRIDFVQHAWSALGHGREVLFGAAGGHGDRGEHGG